jgi:transcriptional regulator with XRE-family HTH domain
MKSGDIIKEAMKATGWSQETLAKQTGYLNKDGSGRQTGVSNRINGNRMRVDIFVKFLNAMGYELVVRSSNPNTNKNEWTVSE